MQTTYDFQLSPAIKGMAILAPRHSRPRMLAQLPQILSLTITAGAGTSPVTLTLTDDRTRQAWVLPAVTGSSNEATLGAAIRAAVAANPKFNSLVTVAATTEVDGSNLVLAFTARHPNRSYTLVRVGGPDGAAATSTATETQAPGGAGLEFGQLVARGAGVDEFAAMTSTTTVDQIAGFLFRTDGNHFHSIPGNLLDEDPADVDTCIRGVHYAIAEDGEFWAQVTEAVTPDSRAHVRVEGANIGDWGDSQAGTPQVLTVTPIVNQAIYGFSVTVTVNGRPFRLRAVYQPTDATTSIADATAGLLDAVNAEITSYGLGSFLTAADTGTTLTVTGAAGILLSEESANVWYLDVEAATATLALTAADVDMLDVSRIARYTTSAAAGGLARIKIQLTP